MSFTLRRATSADAPALCALINELAVYEKLADASAPDPEALAAHLAPDANARCGAVLGEVDDTGAAVGFALFYLRGVAPPEITTGDIYRGAIPFIIIQMIGLVAIIIWPELVTWEW